jgi:hypothetical protein
MHTTADALPYRPLKQKKLGELLPANKLLTYFMKYDIILNEI